MKNGSNKCLHHFVGHAAAVVRDDELALRRRACATETVTVPPGSTLSRPLVIRFSTTCLISCGQISAITGLAGAKHDVFVLILAEVADHFDHAGHQLAQVGVVPLGIAHAGEVEQLLGDLLAAKGFLLNHFEVVADDVAVGRVVVADVVPAARPGGLRATRCTWRSRPADC